SIKSGEKWQRALTYPFGPLGKLTVTNEYVYDGPTKFEDATKVTRDVEKITFTPVASKYELPAESTEKLLYRASKGDIKVEESRGTILFDAKAGRLVNFENKMKLRGNLTLLIEGNPFETEMQQEQSIKVTLHEKNPLLAPK